MKEQATSSKLAQAIAFLRDCRSEYEFFNEKMVEQNKTQNDLLHFLELDNTSYSDRCKTATKLRKCLLERRYYKDRTEERLPIVEFLSEAQNKNLLDNLARILGAVRKAEKYHQNRSYKPRILQRAEDTKKKDDLKEK